MKTILCTLALVLSPMISSAAGHEAKGADAQAIDAACAADAKTANCGDEKVGTGLLKCLHAYKKEHKKDFKVSDGCKSAMEKMHEDHHKK